MVDESKAGHPFFGETDAAQICRESNGLVVVRFRDGVRLDYEGCSAVADVHVEAARGVKCPTLGDVRGLRAANREARDLLSSPRMVAVIDRLAITVGNPVTRVIANFFTRITDPQYAVRIFSDEAAARRWLREDEP